MQKRPFSVFFIRYAQKKILTTLARIFLFKHAFI
jgi:hypothetical protein